MVAERMVAVRPRADIGASKIPLPRDQRDGLPALPSRGTNGPAAALGDSANTATPSQRNLPPKALQRSNSNRHAQPTPGLPQWGLHAPARACIVNNIQS